MRKREIKRRLALTIVALLAFSAVAVLAGCGSKTTGTQSATEGGFIEQTKEAANDAARQANLKTINMAVEVYYAETGTYPTEINQLIPAYLPKIPTDPAGGTYYLVMEGGIPKAAAK
jgi:ABC-type glycerol-3-phosphate transport system substrate-binding protein